MQKTQLEWQVGHSAEKGRPPERFVPARVPGNANLDWAEATGLPDWKFSTNHEQYRWMEDCWWVYRALLPAEAFNGEQPELVAEGVDYACEICLDGAPLCWHEGMFSEIRLPLDAARPGSLLEIWIAPAPKDPAGQPGTKKEAAQCCKPAVSYGWDWHPRLIPAGLWQPVYLQPQSPCRLCTAEVLYTLNEALDEAILEFRAETAGAGAVEFTLLSPAGETVATVPAGQILRLQNPQLWWCNGYGEPKLYTWRASVVQGGTVCDARQGRIGLRRIKLVMNPGAWHEPEEFPKGRSPAPITLELNGVPVFAKGSNWVNPEVFTGTITRETYEPLLRLAQEANFNILRCWGGAIVNKDAFFDLCDELGIMVWQEFMLACNNYRGTEGYLSVLEQEATAILRRLRHRACLVLWCGGNELFNNWSGMTDQSHALRLLNKLCYELDPSRPFLATSPVFGMAHGCYLFRYPDGREVFQVMPSSHFTAYTEFGVPSLSNLETCLAAVPEAELFPLEETPATTAHHAFWAWWAQPTWADLGTQASYFGPPQSAAEMIDHSQWLQAEGYKCIFEEARRQKPYCSMAINWCYNEPWPTLANNSIVNYPATPKKSFAHVAAACRPALASARIPKFSWRGGEEFTCDLWLLNDGRQALPAGEVQVYLELAGTRHHLGSWNHTGAPANQNLAGPTLRMRLPELGGGKAGPVILNWGEVEGEKGAPQQLRLVLEAGALGSTYTLVFHA